MTSTPRRLAYKDAFIGQLVQTIPDVSCEGSPQALDPDYNVILLELSASQWVKLFSSILTGSDLMYPEESHSLHWAWVKGLECGMSFCQKMIECFETDQDTRVAMIQALISELLSNPVQAESFVSAMRQLGIGTDGGNSQTGGPNDALTNKTFADCADFNELYGKCYEWVGALNTIAEDVLQWVELYTNDEELASMLADNIPAIGALPASALEFGLWLQETVSDTYLSAYDTTSQEFWACKIFCEVINGDCLLSIPAVHAAYANELSSFIPPDFSADLGTWLTWYVDLLILDDNEIIGAMHLFIMTVLERLGEIFGSNWRTIQIAIDTASPIASPCDECETWCKVWDLSMENILYGYPERNGLAWINGVGYKPTVWAQGNARYNTINAGLDFTATTITYVKITFNRVVGEGVAGSTNDQFTIGFLPNYENGVNPVWVNWNIEGDGQSREWTGSVQADSLSFQLACATSNDPVLSPLGDLTLYRMELHGVGPNPFGASNC